MPQSGEWSDIASRRPIARSDAEVRQFLQDLIVKDIDPKVRAFFGAPLYVSLIAFPHRAQELVTWAANSPPEDRGQLASAMMELLVRWGYPISEETLRAMGLVS